MEPFQFQSERRLVQLTGLRAANLPQLCEILRTVHGASIFYHTHQAFLTHHFGKPAVTNDFAEWVALALHEDALSERLAALDLTSFTSVRQIREELVALVSGRLREMREIGESPRDCPPGAEFYFARSKSFILPTAIQAAGLEEFIAKLPYITNVSLYFHFLEARLRLERVTNDFSRWFDGIGYPELAREIEALDPYSCSLEELKSRIVALCRQHLARAAA